MSDNLFCRHTITFNVTINYKKFYILQKIYINRKCYLLDCMACKFINLLKDTWKPFQNGGDPINLFTCLTSIFKFISAVPLHLVKLEKMLVLTILPHWAPPSNVTLCALEEAMGRGGQTQGLDGVGARWWDWELHQSNIKVHIAAVKGRMLDNPLYRDDQSSQSRPEHWA